jgi:membrane-associated protein
MFSPEQLMHWVMIAGYIGVFGILFAETGLFIGFFLPGDSLLFIAGLLAGQGMFNILGLAGGGFIAAVLGYGLAYFFGAKLGDWLSHRADSFWFKKRYLVQAHDFYEKHGGKALVLGRLLPIIRTFVPIVAGMARMSWLRYGLWNLWPVIHLCFT